mgnify:CR=1 FL=1
MVCCLDILYSPLQRLARLPSALRAYTKPVPPSQLVVSPMCLRFFYFSWKAARAVHGQGSAVDPLMAPAKSEAVNTGFCSGRSSKSSCRCRAARMASPCLSAAARVDDVRAGLRHAPEAGGEGGGAGGEGGAGGGGGGTWRYARSFLINLVMLGNVFVIQLCRKS